MTKRDHTSSLELNKILEQLALPCARSAIIKRPAT